MSATSARTCGTLFIIATPIGNLEDISLRALSTLKRVDTVLAEDTRHSKRLLSAYDIHKPMLSLHAHNEASKTQSIVDALLNGQSFALISDAGTPLISDPGYPLVHLARSQGIPVTPIPGACAMTAALSAAGVPCDHFSFLGFLPAKSAARQEKLKSLQTLAQTLVFYESTHRIHAAIQDFAEIFGPETPFVLVKELTKTYERFVSGTLAYILRWLEEDPAHEKGEFVLILPARSTLNTSTSNDVTGILQALLEELPVKQAVKLAIKMTGQPKNQLYKMAIELHDTQRRSL